MTIYEVTSDFKRLLELMETTEIDAEVLQDTLEGIEGDYKYKLDSYAKVKATLTGQCEILKKEEERLKERRKAMENNINKLDNTIFESMKFLRMDKLKTDLFTFTIAKNPTSIEVIDVEKVPSQFLIEQPKKVDLKGLKEFLNGSDTDFAKVVRKESLRIR